MNVLGEVTDPEARSVELTSERWAHIVEEFGGHPELSGCQADVLRAVHVPDEIRPGRRANERRYFLRDAAPRRWLQVVVAYEEDRVVDRHRICPPSRPMSIQIANVTFDRVRHDAEGDVLYLHHDDPSTAVIFDASPEGHALRFDGTGQLVGVTIINARCLLERDGEITLTVPTPEQFHLAPDQLTEALAAV